MKRIILVLMLLGTVGYTANRITNADVASNAAIAFSKLAALTSGNILVGNGSNVATSVTMSGDATISNTGALTIANNAVTDAKFRQSAGLSVVGRSANSTGDVADITAGADFNIFRRSGTSIGFGSIDLSQSGAVGSSVLALGNGGTSKSLTAANGGIVYSDADSFEILAAGTSGQVLQSNGAAAPSWVAAPSSDSVKKDINQTGHGLAVGDVIRYNGTAYVESDASADSTSEVYGVVSAVPDANNFTVVTHGYISGLSGLTAGEAHFLSETSGALTTTAPTTSGTVNKPVLLAVSTSAGYVNIQRGYVNGASGGGSTICHFRVNMASGSPVETSDPTNCVASYTDGGTGNFSATFTNSYSSSTSFNCAATESSAGADRCANIDSRTSSSVSIEGIVCSTGSVTDDFEVDVLCTGN